jgi:hypothetical protein
MNQEFRKAKFNEMQIGDVVDFGFQINSTLIVESIQNLGNDLIKVAGKHFVTGKEISHNFNSSTLPAVRILAGA